MRCLFPIKLHRSINDGSIRGVKIVEVPCGKCPACLKKRANNWFFRMKQEQKNSVTRGFLTLTYSDNHVPISPNGYPTLDKKAIPTFIKRIRTFISRTAGYEDWPPLRYYYVGEYGSKTFRPHYHLIIFNLPTLFLTTCALDAFWTNNKKEVLGHIDIRPVEDGCIKYVVGYILKRSIDDEKDTTDRVREFGYMSKGIGKSWLTPQIIAHYKEKLIPYIIGEGGLKLSMPRYFREKIYSEEEKLLLNLKSEAYLSENLIENWKDYNDWALMEVQKQKQKKVLMRQKL